MQLYLVFPIRLHGGIIRCRDTFIFTLETYEMKGQTGLIWLRIAGARGELL
jgi:hypothetical protein